MKKISQSPLASALVAATATRVAATSALQGLSPMPSAPREERIKYLARRADEFAAIDAEAAASRAYAVELECREPTDPAERAEAAACSTLVLKADLLALFADEDRIALELQAAKVQTLDRITAARAAHEALTTRRTAAGLPAPRPVPQGVMTMQGFDTTPRAVLEALDRSVDAPADHSDKIRDLRVAENTLRAAAERERVAEEEAAAAAITRAKDRAEEYARDAARTAAYNAAIDAESAKAHETVMRLADAHRSRSAP